MKRDSIRHLYECEFCGATFYFSAFANKHRFLECPQRLSLVGAEPLQPETEGIPLRPSHSEDDHGINSEFPPNRGSHACARR